MTHPTGDELMAKARALVASWGDVPLGSVKVQERLIAHVAAAIANLQATIDDQHEAINSQMDTIEAQSARLAAVEPRPSKDPPERLFAALCFPVRSDGSWQKGNSTMKPDDVLEVVRPAVDAAFDAWRKKQAGYIRVTDQIKCVDAVTQAALSALSQAGWVVVPREPTEAMVNAGHHEVSLVADAGSFRIMAESAYRAMLAAAPPTADRNRGEGDDMGMFDSVMVPCPTCKKPVEFQSKAGACCCDVFDLATAPHEILTDILNSPEYCRECGSWMALIDPRYPPGTKPKPDLEPVKVKTPENPTTHFQGFKWWPDGKPFTYDDIEPA